MDKAFLLRITDSKVFTALEKMAKQKRWSVNTLINSILEQSVEEHKKKLKENFIISK